ncbi:MAG TPA: DUF6371 domain-containing protein [Perlabentimonas sp.]|nr:DUF6371 domain-containing protein [Perlabentimonas sp.]
MTNTGYKYELMKGSRRYLCPKCQKKEFKVFVKTGTNIVVDSEKFGRCNRQDSCGYFRYPDTNDDWTPPPFVYTPPKPTDYIPIEFVEATFRNFNRNPFFLYLRKIFNLETAYELQSRYLFGTAKVDGTIFWQFDSEKNVRTGKVMYYDKDTGKRLKDRASWYVHRKIKEDFELKQVLFGEHLISMDKPVCLVESEKTAIIMSGFYPDVTWIASGGANMLNSYRLNRLPRLDYVYPDNSSDGKLWRLWEQKTSLFPDRQMDVSVDRAVKDGVLKQGDDILDLELIKRGLV